MPGLLLLFGRGNRALGAGVYYNPLDERVQKAMIAVVGRIGGALWPSPRRHRVAD